MDGKIVYFGFSGPIDSGSVTRISSALNHAVNGKYDGVYLAFSSLGGMIADGVFLYNHIRAMPIPVTIHATGNVASVAVTIFAGANIRLTSRHVLFMIHPAAFPGSTEGMTWDRLHQLMNSAVAEEQRSENILRDRYSIPDDLLNARRFREVHFTPEDAVKFGIAHRVEEFSLPRGCEMHQI